MLSVQIIKERETTKEDVNDRYQDNVYTLPPYLISLIRLNPQTQTKKLNVTDRIPRNRSCHSVCLVQEIRSINYEFVYFIFITNR